MTVDHERIRKAVHEILIAVGEDPDREGLRETPDRVARMYAEMFSGLHKDPREPLHKVFTEPTPLDVVLWVQGTAAAPYLEQGQITDIKTWQDIWNAFGQDSFFGFAAWFN